MIANPVAQGDARSDRCLMSAVAGTRSQVPTQSASQREATNAVDVQSSRAAKRSTWPTPKQRGLRVSCRHRLAFHVR